MPIKLHGGKEYYTVVERMDMLLEEQGKENYSLTTDVTYESGVVIVKATLILYPNARVYCGHALGELGKAKTLEATETHAIGRCLSAAGWFGSEFASANEMESYQSKPKPKPIPENVNPIEIPAEQIEVGAGISGVEAQDDIKLTFGKNKGKMLSECDEGYLEWLQSPKAEKSLSFFDDKSKVEKIQWAAAYFLFKLKEDNKIPF